MPLRTEREVRRRRGCWLGSTEGNRCKLGMENGNWDSAGCDAGALWSQALRLWSTLKFQNQNWHQYWTPLQNLFFFFVDLDRSPFFMYITNLQQKWTLNQHSIVYDQYLQPCPLETIQINKQNQPKNILKTQRHWKEHQPRQQPTTALYPGKKASGIAIQSLFFLASTLPATTLAKDRPGKPRKLIIIIINFE